MTVSLDRRTVLGAVAAGAGGVAAARLLGLRRVVEVDPEHNTVTAAANRAVRDWDSPLGLTADRPRLEQARVAHLLRRATFGSTAAELERAVADGFERTVERLVDTPPAAPPPFPGGDEATNAKPLATDRLQTWWLDWMLASPTPFAERMTLFWHGHFTSEQAKVGLQSPFMYWQNLTWRKIAFGDLRTMLYEVTVDPAMLEYLDLARSTGRNPNENYARELMELFSTGPDAYGEDDVKAAARALAGWRAPRTAAMVEEQLARQLKETGKTPLPAQRPRPDTVRTGIFDASRAFTGAVTFLGVTERYDAESIIERILERDEVAPFITRKMLQAFVSARPSDALVARMAADFRRSRYNVRELLRAVLRSPEFTAPATFRVLVKSPIEFMLHAAKALGAPAVTRLAQQSGAGMGQVLFAPPSVAGWSDHEAWLSSSTMLARANFASAAVGQVRTLPPFAEAPRLHLDDTLSSATLAELDGARDAKTRWALMLSSPEFQLK